MSIKILIFIGALLTLIIGFVFYLLLRLNKLSKSVKNLKKINNQSIKMINTFKTEYSNKPQKYSSEYKLNEKNKEEIIEAVLECIRLDEEENPQKKQIINQQQLEKKPKVSKVKYPPSITKTGFPDNLSDKQNDSYFRFFEIEGGNASFDFCGNNIERAIANKVEIEQACEIVSLGSDSKPTKVENLEKGTVTLRDGKWEVIKKAKINFK